MESSFNYVDLAVQGVQALRPYEPGKPVEELQRELGLDDAVKLASNENPLGASPRVEIMLRESLHDLASYPDGSGFRLKQRLADRHDVSSDRITLGNGSNDVLDLLARVFLGPGRAAVFSEYAFAVYPLVTRAVCAEARVAPALPLSDTMALGHDLDAFAERIDEKVRLVFIANPNNPTGTWLAPDAVEAFLARVPQDVVVVLDEAYRDYLEPSQRVHSRALLERHPNLVLTYTFSKIFGLAGLRVGYSIANPQITDLLNRVRQPFNANSLALRAAELALDDADHIERSVALNTEGLGMLGAALDERRLQRLPSQGNFVTLDIGRDAAPVFEGLLRQGVIVRPLGSYGLPNWLRVTVGTAEQNARFVKALDRSLADT